MGKVIVAGSIVVDMSVSVKEHPVMGETVMGKNLEYSTGGKGFNQAISARRLDADVVIIGKVGGDDYGEMFLEFINNIKGIETYISTVEDKPTGIAMIMVDNKGFNNIVVIPGANDDLSKEDIDEYFENIEEENNILIAQCETPLEVTKYFFTKGKKTNSINILNPAPAMEIPNDIMSLVDILIMNETELEKVSKTQWGYTLDYIKKAMKKIANEMYMFDKIIITTMGDKGALVLFQGEFIEIDGIKVNAIDTTGAGDCFVGAIGSFLSKNKILNKEDLISAVKFANVAAALSVTKKGSSISMPSLNEVKSLII